MFFTLAVTGIMNINEHGISLIPKLLTIMLKIKFSNTKLELLLFMCCCVDRMRMKSNAAACRFSLHLALNQLTELKYEVVLRVKDICMISIF